MAFLVIVVNIFYDLGYYSAQSIQEYYAEAWVCSNGNKIEYKRRIRVRYVHGLHVILLFSVSALMTEKKSS